MTHAILEHEGVLRELQARLLQLHNSYGRMISDEVSHRSAVNAATRWAAALTYERYGDGPASGALAAQMILAELTTAQERLTFAWWGSPLGQAIAWWVGIPSVGTTTYVPSVLVQGALGVSKQRVSELRNAGRAITQEQIRDEMQARWPR